jgi:surface antigen
MVRFAITVMAVCFHTVGWSAISRAQVNPFFNQEAGPGLHDDDFTIMHATSSRLYQQDVVADGAASQWSNPKTGDSGTVTVLQSFQKSGMTCRKVQYEIRLGGAIANNLYMLNWCKTASGEWKILS